MSSCLHVMLDVCSLQYVVASLHDTAGARTASCPLSPNSVDNIYQSVILNCLFSGLRRAVSKLLTSSVKFVRYFLQDNER